MAAALLLLLAFLVAGAGAPVLALAYRRRKQQVIPRAELAVLGVAIKTADGLAAGAKVGDGLACLVPGMRQATHGPHQRAPWARDVAERWQSVVDEYATEHRIGPATEIAPAFAP